MSPLSSGSLTNHENRCDLAITLIKYLFPARTMIDNECNILSNMSKTEFREFRSLMVEMVLHTGDNQNVIQCKHLLSDMSMHFSQLKSMKNLVAATNAEKGR